MVSGFLVQQGIQKDLTPAVSGGPQVPLHAGPTMPTVARPLHCAVRRGLSVGFARALPRRGPTSS